MLPQLLLTRAADAVQDAVRDEGGFLVVVKSVGKANRRIQHFALMSVYSLAKAHRTPTLLLLWHL